MKLCLTRYINNIRVERGRDTRAHRLKQPTCIGGSWWHAMSRALPKRISVSQCELDGLAGCRSSWCAHEVACSVPQYYSCWTHACTCCVSCKLRCEWAVGCEVLVMIRLIVICKSKDQQYKLLVPLKHAESIFSKGHCYINQSGSTLW